MPSWPMHFVVASRVNEKLKLPSNTFLFGNIMPDILEGYLVKDISNRINDYSTHYSRQRIVINEILLKLPGIEAFYEEYQEQLKNPILCGYYVHLLTDYFWNKNTYTNYFKNVDSNMRMISVKLKDGSVHKMHYDEGVRIKQKDFAMFSDYLKRTTKMEYPIYEDSILEQAKDLKEFTYTKEDIKNTILYVQEVVKGTQTYLQEDYKMYNKLELLEKLEECVDFVLQKLR